MKIRNALPALIDCVRSWKRPPELKEFAEGYFSKAGAWLDGVFDPVALHEVLADLDWSEYRKAVLTIDPNREEARVRKHLHDVERLFGIQLEGEIILFGAFGTMDGYARFDRGTHRVFLGIDESGGRSRYLDILEVHELTHVARESRPEVWRGWRLDPRMSHDTFVEVQPVIEHLFGEGFSCAVSERLVPCDEPWHYVYQEKADFEKILSHASSLDTAIHRELDLGADGDWSKLYSPASYRPRLPVFTHYFWAWKWASRLIQSRGKGDPRALLEVCSREFLEDASSFLIAE